MLSGVSGASCSRASCSPSTMCTWWSQSGSPSAFTRPWATSTRKPSAPRSSQKRRTERNSSHTSGFSQLRSGWVLSNRCRYHCPSGSRVQASPPNTERQLFGGSSPCSPRPSRNMYRSRSGLPGPAATAARNHSCSLEVWLGTRSTISRIPSSAIRARIRSKSSRVPKRGSTSR